MNKTLLSRFVSLLLAAAMCVCLCACSGEAAPAEKIKIKLSTSWGENSSVQEGALKFGELLSEASDGRFEVTVYPSNQLASGNQQTAVEMVQNGDIEAALFGMTVLSFLDDRLAVVNMPFLIPSYEDADRLLFDETAESRILLDELLQTNGMQSLAFGEAGYRQITNNKHEVRTPDDMKGLKFRVLSTCPMFFDLYEALGANPTAINMSEVFTSLQQGVVDGQENAVDTARSYKLSEVQSYITCWNGVYDAVAFVGSPQFWDSLSAEDQQLVKDCAKQAMDFQRETARASEAEILDEFEETMTITTLSDEEVQAFKDAVQPVYDKWFDAIGADVMAAFGYTK
jgi:tripartite ATP-independent transporter DctP family solute receptor